MEIYSTLAAKLYQKYNKFNENHLIGGHGVNVYLSCLVKLDTVK